ncbi:Hypothetical predicted protein [Cloeon dipterum]|uniref:Metalloendopeptidase n=1 Tax=Cloeon dipterum TaxID=197152 RepID=A0A8S1C644_9INSE|nr:Hypothetical predicted protein [Cloeon dipterum]
MFLATALSACVLLVAVQGNPLPSKWDLYAQSVLRARQASLGYPVKSLGSGWNPDSKVNPEELGPYYQGDILTIPDGDRNGLTNTAFRWPGGVVPYVILDGVFSDTELQFIRDAIDLYHQNTCITFVPYDGTQSDYVVIQSEATGCWSTVGRKGGVQYLNLQSPGCIRRVGTPIHELMHAVGFFHEQTRTDRDGFVNILWENIETGYEHNFEIEPDTTAFGVAYDFGSVLHYSEISFSVNGLPTIETKPAGIPIGQRDGFSQSDIDKINIMYNCAAKK